MAGKLGAFQTRKMNYVNGMVKENHIGAMFQKEPQKAPWAMVQLLERKFGKSWESFFLKYPVKYFKTHDKYYWDVIGDSRRNVALVELRSLDGTAVTSGSIGANYAPFFAVFAEDYFHKGEVIYGEKNEKGAILRIRSEKPIMEGRNAVYEVECFGAKLQNGLTVGTSIRAGERFSYGPAYVGETLSREVGDLGYETPMNMSNNWSTVRIKTKVPGGMENVMLAAGIPYINKDGKKAVANYWMQYVDYKLEAKFSDYKNLALAYGVSTELEDGSYSNTDFSGEPIKTGAGLIDQMDVNGVKYYNDFSLDMITNELYQLSSTKIGLDEDRTFVLSMGEAAAIDFHKSVMTEASGWHIFELEGTNVGAIKKVSSPLHSNALSAGFQFVEYLAPNNVKVRIQIDPWKDDPVTNKIMWKGAPAMSRRIDIFYIGNEEQPNIQLCRVEGADEYRGYQWGLRNSFTKATNNPYMSYDEDSTTIHKMSNQFGICILDPTRTRSFVPDVLRGV